MKHPPTLEPRRRGSGRSSRIVVALPEPSLSLSQDAEWCVVNINGQWRQIRFHDYATLYSIPGLYEKVIYEILGCDSPRTVCDLLLAELAAENAAPESLRVLDLGAGNGIVGAVLRQAGARFLIGVDIIEEAASATERDRPAVYDNYHVVDLTALDPTQQRELAGYKLNAMTCIAALGFGDIPPRAFASAFNFVAQDGWIAFNIKQDFLTESDDSGFSKLIAAITSDETLEIHRRKLYQHRKATSGEPLLYTALVGQKRRDISEAAIAACE